MVTHIIMTVFSSVVRFHPCLPDDFLDVFEQRSNSTHAKTWVELEMTVYASSSTFALILSAIVDPSTGHVG
jgi:hypothetical protein